MASDPQCDRGVDPERDFKALSLISADCTAMLEKLGRSLSEASEKLPEHSAERVYLSMLAVNAGMAGAVSARISSSLSVLATE